MKLHPAVEKLIGFIIVGIVIALAAWLLVFLSQLIFLGAIIGLILFAGMMIKEKFFSASAKGSSSGRTIEHEE